MSNTSFLSAAATRRLRAASPALHGGASSMLRLARGGESRLPSGAALSGWAERAAAMLDLAPMMVGPVGAVGPFQGSALPPGSLIAPGAVQAAARGVRGVPA